MDLSSSCNDLIVEASLAHKAVRADMDPLKRAESWTRRKITWVRRQDLRKLHVFVSDPARTHLRPAEAPSAQIGRRRDLEMVTPLWRGDSGERRQREDRRDARIRHWPM